MKFVDYLAKHVSELFLKRHVVVDFLNAWRRSDKIIPPFYCYIGRNLKEIFQ